jgi:hypothetical protein
VNREFVYQPDDCPNCGKPNSAVWGSTSWGHDYMCCSEACGIRLGQKIDAGMIDLPRYKFGPFGNSRDDDTVLKLRKRIKELEGQLKANNIKPMKSRI